MNIDKYEKTYKTCGIIRFFFYHLFNINFKKYFRHLHLNRIIWNNSMFLKIHYI